ncbi:MAG: TVP38/TMEM64 family protein, partial [Deltaproteobacteria bacterium]|nr:TVP38/TMEM64 family protein [Deltaproteobacteria bacterium]
MNRKKIILLLLAALFVGLFFWFGLGRYLTLDFLKQNRDDLLNLYRDHRLLTVVVFMAIYITQTALALPGAAILTLAAGAVFGVLMGTVYANIGATIGASISFLVARYLFRDTIQGKFG